MSLYSPQQEPLPSNNLQTIYLINPTVSEFKTSYFNDKNEAIEVILAPLETKEFPHSVGQIVLTHLADFILQNEGFAYKTSPKKELAAIKRRCIINE